MILRRLQATQQAEAGQGESGLGTTLIVVIVGAALVLLMTLIFLGFYCTGRFRQVEQSNSWISIDSESLVRGRQVSFTTEKKDLVCGNQAAGGDLEANSAQKPAQDQQLRSGSQIMRSMSRIRSVLSS
mmetsp:Transcript_18859/g.32234  ORF Transcript_18859/g.32234 Transcript_18859/m.32234 type:complete len:128 (-) Transcript_18859:962-1345(-)